MPESPECNAIIAIVDDFSARGARHHSTTRTRCGRCATASRPQLPSFNCTHARGLSVARHSSRLLRFDCMPAVSWSRPTALELPSKHIGTRSLDRQIICASYFRGKASEVVLQPKLNQAFRLAEAEVAGRGISSSRESNLPRGMHDVYSDVALQEPLSVRTVDVLGALAFTCAIPVKAASE